MKAKAEQIKIINQAHYYHQAIISLENFKLKFSKDDRKEGLIKRIDDYERICNVIAPLYWNFSFASGYIRERDGNNYLIFDNALAINKELLKNTQSFGI